MSQSNRSNLHYHSQALLIQKALKYSYILYITAPYLIDQKHNLSLNKYHLNTRYSLKALCILL